VSSEGLFSEFLITSVLHGIHFKSVGVTVDVMCLSEKVRDWIESSDKGETQAENNLGVWYLRSSDVHKIFRNIMSHLRGR